MSRISIGYLVAFISSFFMYLFVDQFDEQFEFLVLLFAIQFPLFLLLVKSFKNLKKLPLKTIFLSAIVIRIIAIPSTPLLEDDYYRYLWDGHVQNHGINPFLHAPNSEALDHIHTDYRENINYIHIKTIYPPLAQYFFRAVHFVKANSLITLKVGLVLFDLLTALVLLLWLRSANKPEYLTLFYLFNPLVVKEFANSAHLDSLSVFFVTLALFLYYTHKRAFSWLSLALAISVKLYAVILIPFFFKLDKNRLKHLFAATLTFAVLFIPFLDAGMDNILNGLTAFSKYWYVNSSLYIPIRDITGFILANTPFLSDSLTVKSILVNNLHGRYAIAFIFSCLVFYLFLKLKDYKQVPLFSFVALTSLLCLSTVYNAWYLIWILPMAAFYNFRPVIIHSALIIAVYSYFYDKQLYPYLQFVEYLIFYSLIIFYFYKKRETHSNYQEASI